MEAARIDHVVGIHIIILVRANPGVSSRDPYRAIRSCFTRIPKRRIALDGVTVFIGRLWVT